MLKNLPKVKIDEQGVYKYIIISVKDLKTSSTVKLIRGYKKCEYHKNIKGLFLIEFLDFGLKLNDFEILVLGGGRINFNFPNMLIYGYSIGYGQGDHELAKQIINEFYKGELVIDTSNEGY